jgi:hypothetical protein
MKKYKTCKYETLIGKIKSRKLTNLLEEGRGITTNRDDKTILTE